MATAGTGRLTRRGVHRAPALAPEDVGTALREAREQLGATLAEIRDRTGVAFEILEALEAMDLARLPDQRTVVTAARRYSEVVGLDPSEICGKALSCWQDQHLNEPVVSAPAVSAPAARSGRQRRRQAEPTVSSARRSTPGQAGDVPSGDRNLDRHDTGTNSHLRSFTQTAEVPFAAGRGARSGVTAFQFADTGSVPLTWNGYGTRYRTPLWFRVTMLLTTALLLIGLAGLAVHRYEPKWLTEIHLTRQTPSGRGTNRSAIRRHSTLSAPPSTPASASKAVVTQVSDGTGAATATVQAASYQVVVVAQKPCWVDATTASGSPPVFVGLLEPGETQSLSPVDGRLSVEFGSSYATVAIEVAGKVSSGWFFRPAAAPFTLNFVPSAST